MHGRTLMRENNNNHVQGFAPATPLLCSVAYSQSVS